MSTTRTVLESLLLGPIAFGSWGYIIAAITFLISAALGVHALFFNKKLERYEQNKWKRETIGAVILSFAFLILHFFVFA